MAYAVKKHLELFLNCRSSYNIFYFFRKKCTKITPIQTNASTQLLSKENADTSLSTQTQPFHKNHVLPYRIEMCVCNRIYLRSLYHFKTFPSNIAFFLQYLIQVLKNTWHFRKRTSCLIQRL